MKYLLLILLFASCKQHKIINCQLPVPKGYCLYYNDYSKAFVISQQVMNNNYNYFTIDTTTGTISRLQGRMETWFYDGIYRESAGWSSSPKKAIQYDDSCLAKSGIAEIIDHLNEEEKKRINDSINAANEAKLAALKNNYKPVKCN